MREEIIPEMLKSMSPMRNMKFGFEESDEEKDDTNPDWADAIEKSGLGDKLREMNELQLEGADVYMSTFAQLKSYPFFREISNWFYPSTGNNRLSLKSFVTGKQKEEVCWKSSCSLVSSVTVTSIRCSSPCSNCRNHSVT